MRCFRTAIGILVMLVTLISRAELVSSSTTDAYARAASGSRLVLLQFVDPVVSGAGKAGKLIKKSINITASTVLRNLPLGKVLKFGDVERGMDHILRRHSHGVPSYPGHPSTYDGHFKNGWHMTHITDAIETALTRSNGSHTMNAGNEVYEVMLDNVIGKGINRSTGVVADTRKLRVIVDPNNSEIISAYPIPE